MNVFALNLKYGFKRLFADKMIWLLVAIPVGLIVINSLMEDPFYFEGYNVMASFNMPAFLLAFQFFNMGIVLHFLYHDITGDMRWRLRATPHSMMSYVLPAFVASWIFSIFLGLIIIFVSVVFLNAYLGSLLVLSIVFLLTSLLATALAMLLFLAIDKFGVANTLVYVISFGFMIISGFMFPLGDSDLAQFIMRDISPLGLGVQAIANSSALGELAPWIDPDSTLVWRNIGILAAMAVVVSLAAAILSRRSKKI